MPRSRRRRHAEDTNNFPSEVVLETLMLELKAQVDDIHKSQWALVVSVTKAVAAFACVNKSNRQLVASCRALNFYRFFVDALVDSRRARRFLDGTFGVDLFEGSYGEGPRDLTKFQRLVPAEVLMDRKRTAETLARKTLQQLAGGVTKYVPNDLPAQVGTRVAIFVGRARLLAQQCAQRPANTCACGRCGRQILRLEVGLRIQGAADVSIVGPTIPPRADAPFDDSSDEEEVVDFDGSTSYWLKLASSSPSLPALHLCCRECELQYEDELALVCPFTYSMLEVAEDEFEAVAAKPDGVKRVVAAARAVGKRNAVVLRHLREARRAHQALPTKAISEETVERLHAHIADAIHLDLALLLAAETLAQSPNLARGRALAGAKQGWRHAGAFETGIQLVKNVYLRHKTGSTSLTFGDPRSPPKWLRSVMERAEAIFPRPVLPSWAVDPVVDCE